MVEEKPIMSDQPTMPDARETILRRVRTALRDVPPNETPSQVAIPRDYRQQDERPHEEIIADFMHHVADYKATVRRINQSELKPAIADLCAAQQAQRLATPRDIPPAWLPERIECMYDEGLSRKQLNSVDGVLTGCALAIAQTGSLVLDGGAFQGRRMLTLLPDFHLCIVFTNQIVGIVPEAIKRLTEGVYAHARPITFISGSSATSDIELHRVEGVHGPRRLAVLVVNR